MSIYINGVKKEGFDLFVDPYHYDSQVGNWGWTARATAKDYGYVINANSADGDYMTFDRFITKGTYTLKYSTRTNSVQGMVSVDIDGVEVVSSKDHYSAGDVDNVRMEETGLVVPTTGIHVIKFRLDGKHASATDYYAQFSTIVFHME